MHSSPRIVHPLGLVLALVLASTWKGTSAPAGICRVGCLIAVTGYLVYILAAILRDGLAEFAVPSKKPMPPGLWDRDLDGAG